MNTYLKDLYNNVRGVLIDPALFWKEKKAGYLTNSKLLAGYLIPLIVFAALGVFAGGLFRGSLFYLLFPAYYKMQLLFHTHSSPNRVEQFRRVCHALP